MTAVQFMRNFDDTLARIESISDKTAVEQKTMLESAQPYTTREGLFEMAQLMDVAVSDEHEIPIWNSEKPQLNEVDKGLIVEELAEMLKHMHEDVIDFSNIPAMSTVIQNKLGYKVNLDDYITDMITNAADWQDSQAFAHGRETPGVDEAEHTEFVEPEEGDRTPTDIAPKESGVGTGPEVIEVGEVDDLGDLAGAVAGAFGGEETEIGDEFEGETLGAEELGAGNDEGFEGENLADENEFEPEELASEESEDDLLNEENKPRRNGEEEEEDLDDLLESIKATYENKTSLMENLIGSAASMLSKEHSIDAQLESIRTSLLEGTEDETPLDECGMTENIGGVDIESLMQAAKNVKENNLHEAAEAMLTESKLNTLTESYHYNELAKIAQELKEENLNSMLESIANGYHSEKEAQLEAVQHAIQLDTQLEAITNKYHGTQKALQEAAQHEQELDKTLSSLIESYHAKQPTANAKARLEAREKIQGLSK